MKSFLSKILTYAACNQGRLSIEMIVLFELRRKLSIKINNSEKSLCVVAKKERKRGEKKIILILRFRHGSGFKKHTHNNERIGCSYKNRAYCNFVHLLIGSKIALK